MIKKTVEPPIYKGTIYVGIDPGWTGAIAALYPNGKIQSWHVFTKQVSTTMPLAKTAKGNPRKKTERWYRFREMYMLLNSFRAMQAKGFRVIVAIEAQHSRPTDSKFVATSVGRNQGIWEALAGANKLEVVIIQPQVWKPRYIEPGAPKSRSLEMCQTLYPEVDLPLKKDEARAEAILIADYCRRRDQTLDFPRRPPSRRRRPKPRHKQRKFRSSRAIPRNSR